MLEHENGKLLTDQTIYNKKTYAMYHPKDVKVIEVKGQFHIVPIYHEKKINKFSEISNWSIKEKKEPALKITEKNIVKLDKLNITYVTDSFNILLITYIKEMSGGSIVTTNQKRLKHLISILVKSPGTPLPWKYVDDLLSYVSSTKEMFLTWIGEGHGKEVQSKNI